MAEEKNDNNSGIEILDRDEKKTKRPGMFVVYVHNDPITPRAFVVGILRRFFSKTEEQAVTVMMAAHTMGMSVAGTYTSEVAETKANVANSYSRAEGFPLTFSVQEE